MKRLFISLLALLLILAIGSPYVVGIYAEDILRQQVAAMASTPGYSASLENYQRGWRSSSASVRFGFDPAFINTGQNDGSLDQEALDGLAQLFSFDIQVEHGPVLFSEGFRLGLAHILGHLSTDQYSGAEELKHNAGIKEFISSSVHIGFTGDGTLSVTSPAFAITLPGSEISSLGFSGFDFDGEFSREGRFKGAGQMPEFTLQADQVFFVLSGLSLSSDMYRLEDYIWLGDSALTVESMELQTATGEQILLQNLDVDAVVETADNLLIDLVASYKLGEVRTSGFDLRNVEMTLAYERIAIPAIREYIGFFQEFGPAQQDPQAMQQLSSELAENVLPEFLQYSPAFAINRLAFNWNNQSFESSMRVAFDGSDFAPPDNLEDLGYWLANSRIEAKASASQALAEEATAAMLTQQLQASIAQSGQTDISAEQIQEYVSSQTAVTLSLLEQQGMLTKTGEGYTAEFELSKGEATLNGAAIPLSGLLPTQ